MATADVFQAADRRRAMTTEPGLQKEVDGRGAKGPSGGPQDAGGLAGGHVAVASASQRKKLFGETRLILLGLFTATGSVATLAAPLLSLQWTFVATALLPLALIYGLALNGLDAHPHSRFGLANSITALRAAMTCIVAAAFLPIAGLAERDVALWILAGLVLLALSLDGVDGALARRAGQESAFGARFDMEVDAFLILVLSAGAAQLDKAGPWVLLIGLLRYAFVLASWIDPRLTRPLCPSFRRKLVCVVQILCLCLILLPVIVPPLSNLIAAAALAALVYSFARDTLFLLRQPR